MSDQDKNESPESLPGDTPCSDPHGTAGDVIWRDDPNNRRRELKLQCSPYGNWVKVGSRIKD